MRIATLEDIVQGTIKLLHQHDGAGVQTYSEDIIAKHVNDAFELSVEEEWWRWLRYAAQHVLDGSTGTITTDTPLTEFSSVQYVYRDGSNTPLPNLPENLDPFTLSGSTPQYIAPRAYDDSYYSTRPFVVYPLDATGTVTVIGMKVPELPITLGSATIPMDALLLERWAAWLYLDTDGSNPAAAAVCQALTNNRLTQLRALNSSGSVQLDPRLGSVPDQWTSWPTS